MEIISGLHHCLLFAGGGGEMEIDAVTFITESERAVHI